MYKVIIKNIKSLPELAEEVEFLPDDMAIKLYKRLIDYEHYELCTKVLNELRERKLDSEVIDYSGI